ncbi:glycosyltransferase, partial [bacterium]|nr:glycosyltransferase [bacterium]
MSMRIAVTADPEIPVPPILYGGIERIVDMLVRELSQRGHEVTLFAHPESTCPVKHIAWPGGRARGKLDTLRNTITLAQHIVSGRFDIIHSFSRIAYLTPLLPLKLPKLMTYQREISPHTTVLANYLSRGTLEFSAISNWMLKPVHCVGSWHLVPNGVPLSHYDFCSKVAEDAPLIFLGRVEEIKGPHLAIEIAKQAGRRLVIAGNIPIEHQAWFDRHIAQHIDNHQI